MTLGRKPKTLWVVPQDAAQAALAVELKALIMSGYRHQLEVFNDSA
ncbi:hypothetical protein J2W17_005050 [Pseudomonas lini]|nr:hypothetical protein [Pseudomonas lini]